jgi:hypothetical protein
VSQSNIFGSGKYMSFGISNGSVNKNATLSFTDPYFTADGVSLGYDLYHRVYKPYNSSSSSTTHYKTSTDGVAMRFGVPVTETDRINFSLGLEQTKVGTWSDSPTCYLDFVNKYGSNNLSLIGTAGWGRDTRDSSLWPTRGANIKVQADAALPGGDLEWYRLTHSQQWFFPLSKTFTLMLNGEVGYANGYGKTSTLPFFQNFYLGGLGSVRGYDSNSLGPKDASTGDYLGGTRKMVANAEILFPFPGMKDKCRYAPVYSLTLVRSGTAPSAVAPRAANCVTPPVPPLPGCPVGTDEVQSGQSPAQEGRRQVPELPVPAGYRLLNRKRPEHEIFFQMVDCRAGHGQPAGLGRRFQAGICQHRAGIPRGGPGDCHPEKTGQGIRPTAVPS